jgi:hypothetical protein
MVRVAAVGSGTGAVVGLVLIACAIAVPSILRGGASIVDMQSVLPAAASMDAPDA